MVNIPEWLPRLLKLEDYNGNWKHFIDKAFSIFYRDFIQTQPLCRGLWVRCRRDYVCDGKEAGFWHCISEGSDEQNRTPDLRRCERIAWVRAVIEHSNDETVDCWTNDRSGEKRQLLWFNEEFLVVLAERTRRRDRFKYLQLITAYYTFEEHRKAKLRNERDSTYKNG